MGKGLETGKAFLAGVLSKITDPGQRATAESLLANETFVTEIGNGVEGQAEIDRQLQKLRTDQETLTTQRAALEERDASLTTWYGQLTDWRTQNEALIAAGKAAQGSGVKPPVDKKEIPVAGLTEEQLNERLTAERAAFLGFTRDQNQLTRDHFSKFGEVLNLEPLLTHPEIAKVGLTGVYELVHKERLEKHKTDAAASAEEKIRADERQKVMAAQAQMPYPSVTGTGSGSPLDALTVGKSTPLVDEAVAHYGRLQAERATH